MIEGRTTSGYEYKIDEAVKSDWRFVRALSSLKELEESDSQEVDFINIMAEIEQLLFSDKGKAFEKFLSDQNEGRIPTELMLAELLEIIKGDGTKNS